MTKSRNFKKSRKSRNRNKRTRKFRNRKYGGTNMPETSTIAIQNALNVNPPFDFLAIGAASLRDFYRNNPNKQKIEIELKASKLFEIISGNIKFYRLEIIPASGYQGNRFEDYVNDIISIGMNYKPLSIDTRPEVVQLFNDSQLNDKTIAIIASRNKQYISSPISNPLDTYPGPQSNYGVGKYQTELQIVFGKMKSTQFLWGP